MARKRYILDFVINSTQAESAARRVIAALRDAEAAAKRTGQVTVQSNTTAAASAQRTAQQTAAAATRVANAQVQAAQRSAAAQIAAQQAVAKQAVISAQQAERAQARANQKAAAAAQQAAREQARSAQQTARDVERAATAQAQAALKAAASQIAAQKAVAAQAVMSARQATRARQASAKADEASATQGMVGLGQLQASGLRLQEQLLRGAAARAKAEDRLRAKSLTDEQIALMVRNRMVADHNKRRVDAAMRAAGVEKQTFSDIMANHKGLLVGIGASVVAMRVLMQMGQAYARAMKEAGEESRRMANKFTQGRDELGELASIMDVPLDNKFMLDFAKFNVRTGLRPEESKRFQTSFYGSGAQHIGEGKHISADQGLQFKELAGRFAAANRIDPEVIGDLAGQILASSDFSKDGDKAAENALTKLNTVFQIGKRGRGANPVLLHQFVKSAATMLREDQEQGIMRSPEEVMTMISVMAERNPEDAETYARRATEGLRAFAKPKASPLLKKAKILPTDAPLDAARKLMPVVRAEAAKRGPGVTDVDILREHYQEREATGIATIFRAIEAKTFEDRAAYAAKFNQPGVAMDALKNFGQGEAGLARQADAQIEQAEAGRGAENSQLDILRRQAKARLIEEKRIGTSWVKMKQWIANTATMGTMDYSDEALIDLEASRMLNERIPGTARDMPSLPNAPERREEMFRRHIGIAEQMNVNPLTGGPLIDALQQNTVAVQKNNDLMEKQNVQPGRGPQAMPVAPQAPAALPAAP